MDTWIVTNASVNGTLVTEVAGDSVSNFLALGFACLPTYCEGTQTEQVVQIADEFEAEYGEPLGNHYALPGYALADAVVAAIEAAGSTDGPAIAEALFSGQVQIDYFGTPMAFTENCHRPQPAGYSVEEFQNGVNTQIGTVGRAADPGHRRRQPVLRHAAGRRVGKENRPRQRHDEPMNDAVDGSARAKLVAEGIHVHFEGVRAVDGIDLTLEQGQIMGLIGPNGAGKTTFMNAVSGFVPLTAGTVTMEDQTVSGLPPQKLVRLGLVRTFQDVATFPELTVFENIELGALGAGLSRKHARKRAWELIDEPRPSARRAPARLGASARRGAHVSASPAPSPSSPSSSSSTSRPRVSTTPRAWR